MVSNVSTPTEKQLAIEKAARESNPMEKLGDSMVFEGKWNLPQRSKFY